MSLRGLAALLLVAAVALAWLSLGDRLSPAAMHVVEWEGRLGAPLWALTGALGVALGLLGGRGAKPPPAPARQPRPAKPTPQEALGEDWMEELHQRAAALDLGPGCSLRVASGKEAAQGAFVLELTRRTPEQARRAVVAFAGFLAGAPTPPRARIRFVDCPAPAIPRAKQVSGALRGAFAPDAVTVTGTEDRVELLFRDPDPRWQGTG
ncbi:MAG: hypothetical protein H6741_24090 [Alphaproteobacteria bacterium]|nr:hypothetical protein [Alphaproteobacteria bacterium]MCB9795788.1 hypothetical protein [Alphaproteobacteria bacterium]